MSSMAFDQARAFALDSPAIASLAGVLVVASVVWHLVKRQSKLDLPIVQPVPGNYDHDQALQEGVSKYPDIPFVLQTTPPLVILPALCLNEVKSLPENQVSMMQEVWRKFSANVTNIGHEAHDIIPAIKNDLTRHITSVLDGLQDETRYSLATEFGPCEDWTSHNVYHKLTRIVALLSGRVFVGRPLSRDEEWINATTSYSMACVKAGDACAKYHPILRPIVGPFLPEVIDLKKHRQRGADMLKPLLDDILKREQMGLAKPNFEEYEDEQGIFCSWMLKYADDRERRDPLRLANNQMGLSFAAIHTSSMTLSQAVYDLASKPEYIKMLREEIQHVIAEDGQDVDGEGFVKLKKTSFAKLRKLDSFVKESQRLAPLDITSINRVTTSPITLSTGHTLPTGTRFAFASHAIHTSPSTETFSPSYNPADYTNPAEFDGLRFYKLRAMPGKENKHQFVTTAPSSLAFGHGSHACPGRFFASNEIKVVLVELLQSWDVRLKGDIEGKGGERPANMMSEFTVVPNMKAELEFRRVKKESKVQ